MHIVAISVILENKESLLICLLIENSLSVFPKFFGVVILIAGNETFSNTKLLIFAFFKALAIFAVEELLDIKVYSLYAI